MGVYKRGTTYYVRVVSAGQIIRRAIGPDRKTAEAVQKKLEAEIAASKAAGLPWAGLAKIQKARKQLTFAEVAEHYISGKELKASSKRTYRDNLEHLLSKFGSLKVSQITPELIRKFQEQLKNELLPVPKRARTQRDEHASGTRTRSSCRVNNIMILLRSIMKHSLKQGLIAENPCLSVPCLKEDPASIDPLTLDELQLALSCVRDFYRPLFTVLAWSGIRPNEARALRWNNIDWKRGEIKICRGRARGTEITEAGIKTKYVEGTPKTTSSIRVIQMHPEVRRALEELQQRGVNNLNGYVFLTKKGQPFDIAIDDIWAAALKKAGIRHRTSYQLRHQWASMALEAGESPAWVARMLGHDTMATTFKYYGRWIPNQQNGKLIGQLGTDALTQKLTHKA